jgi:hypothetical protein
MCSQFKASVVRHKSFAIRLHTLSGSAGVGLEPVGTETKRFRQAPTVGNPTRRGWGGGPQATGLLATGGRPARVEFPNVKKWWTRYTNKNETNLRWSHD